MSLSLPSDNASPVPIRLQVTAACLLVCLTASAVTLYLLTLICNRAGLVSAEYSTNRLQNCSLHGIRVHSGRACSTWPVPAGCCCVHCMPYHDYCLLLYIARTCSLLLYALHALPRCFHAIRCATCAWIAIYTLINTWCSGMTACSCCCNIDCMPSPAC